VVSHKWDEEIEGYPDTGEKHQHLMGDIGGGNRSGIHLSLRPCQSFPAADPDIGQVASWNTSHVLHIPLLAFQLFKGFGSFFNDLYPQIHDTLATDAMMDKFLLDIASNVGGCHQCVDDN